MAVMGPQVLIPCQKKSFYFLLWAQQVFPGELVEIMPKPISIFMSLMTKACVCSQTECQQIKEFQVARLDSLTLFLYFHTFLEALILAPRVEQKFYGITTNTDI